jgi:hypothetical protein
VSDFIVGTVVSDTIEGFDGNDTLNAAGGNDLLVGGDGDDLFRFDGNNGTGTTSGFDEISDFQGAGVAGGDMIELFDASPFEVWGVFEEVGQTVFKLIDTTFNVVTASVTVLGVTGLVADDDYAIFSSA